MKYPTFLILGTTRTPTVVGENDERVVARRAGD